MGVLEAMDRQLGRLFDYIRDSKKLCANTLVLICSDNGCERGAGLAGPLKGYKMHLYEGGIRSPLVVWGPGLMARDAIGKRNKDSVFAAIDLVPSLLKLAGATGPADTNYDGEDVLDVLLGKSEASRKAPIFFGRPPDCKEAFGFKDLPDLSVRHGKWKLLCDYDGTKPHLYDLNEDPGESKNLAEAQPEVTQELIRKVLDWYHSMPSSK